MQESDRLIKLFSEENAGGREPDFCYLLRLLENLSRDLPRIGEAESPSLEAVRFGQMPFLGFTDKKIHSVTRGGSSEGRELLNIMVYFFGLLGPNGPMPLEVTDYVYHRTLNNADPVIRRFLDIINHRFLTFYYRACSMFEMASSFDRKDDRLLDTFRSLNHQTIRSGTALASGTELARTAILIQGSRNKKGLENILKAHFGKRIRVREFVEKFHLMPKEVRMKLGDPHTSVLGLNAQIGTHYRTRTQDLCIELGPVSYQESLMYMPESRYFREMHDLVTMYLRKNCQLHLELHIDGGTIPRIALNGSGALGQGTHLISAPAPGTVTTVTISMSSVINRTDFHKQS